MMGLNIIQNDYSLHLLYLSIPALQPFTPVPRPYTLSYLYSRSIFISSLYAYSTVAATACLLFFLVDSPTCAVLFIAYPYPYAS